MQSVKSSFQLQNMWNQIYKQTHVQISVLVSTRNDQSRSQFRLLRLSGLSLSLESRPDKDLVSVSMPKIFVFSAADLKPPLFLWGLFQANCFARWFHHIFVIFGCYYHIFIMTRLPLRTMCPQHRGICRYFNCH